MSLFKIYFALLGVLILFALFYRYQRRAIYSPQRYGPLWCLSLKPDTVELAFNNALGRQMAFYVSPSGNSEPPRVLWVMFHGIGATALDWMAFVEEHQTSDTGFLLVDYPGYGHCEGQPSEPGMIRNANGALRALAEHLKMSPRALATRTNVLGYSMGAAAALAVACRWPVRRVVLLAPFTSLSDIANHRHGPIGWLLWDRFDNRAAIRELLTRKQPPAITIFHGDNDPSVPFAMGRELANLDPAIEFHRVRGAKHSLMQFPNVRRAVGRLIGLIDVR